MTHQPAYRSASYRAYLCPEVIEAVIEPESTELLLMVAGAGKDLLYSALATADEVTPGRHGMTPNHERGLRALMEAPRGHFKLTSPVLRRATNTLALGNVFLPLRSRKG